MESPKRRDLEWEHAERRVTKVMSLGSMLERRMRVSDEAALERWPFRQERAMEEVHETTSPSSSSLRGVSSNSWSTRLRDRLVLLLLVVHGMFAGGLGMVRRRDGCMEGGESWLRAGRAILSLATKIGTFQSLLFIQ